MTDVLTELSPDSIRNRVVKTVKMRFGDLMAHPMNPKYHPLEQRELLGEVLTNIGWIGSVPVYHSERNKGLTLLDGHLRKNIAPDLVVEVNIHDLDDKEADTLIALYDEVGRKAEIDPALFDSLRAHLNTDNAMFAEAFAEMAEWAGMYEPDEEPGGGSSEKPHSDGSLLKLVDITIEEPRHKVEHGDIWGLDRHILVCADVITEWDLWTPYLKNPGDTIFAPFPGPLVPLSIRAEQYKFVMVQPDTYIAGHILDRYTDTKGEGRVVRKNN